MIWLVEVGRYRKVIPPVDDISAVFSRDLQECMVFEGTTGVYERIYSFNSK